MQSARAALGDSPKKREKTVRLESGTKIFRDKLNSNSAALDKSSEDFSQYQQAFNVLSTN